jgi:hypothetical protein
VNCKLIITELGTLGSNPAPARYIELYSEDCIGAKIGDNFKLVGFFDNAIDLQSKVIGDDGFFVIRSKEEGDLQGKCDEIVGEDTPRGQRWRAKA